MLKKIQNHYQKGDLVLRDYLSAHRTILANDRSFLASIRTSLTLFVAGVTFIRFFNYRVLYIVGWIFIPLSIAFLLVGISRYAHMRRVIHNIKYDEDVIKEEL